MTDTRSPTFSRRRFALSGAAFATGLCGPASAVELSVSGGPRELFIAYRCAPEHRPALRAYWRGEGAARLERMRRAGEIASYRVLFSMFVNTRTWDALAIVTFTRFEDIARWAGLEASAPGGLPARGLAIAQPFETISADLAWSGDAATQGDASAHVYYVIPYTYNALGEYRAYVNGYVIPQLEGWMGEGVLDRYWIYLNRHPVGDPDPWDALFVYAYRDLDAFGRRQEVVARVREPLRGDAVWSRYHEIKATLRSESENIIAQTIAAS